MVELPESLQDQSCNGSIVAEALRAWSASATLWKCSRWPSIYDSVRSQLSYVLSRRGAGRAVSTWELFTLVFTHCIGTQNAQVRPATLWNGPNTQRPQNTAWAAATIPLACRHRDEMLVYGAEGRSSCARFAQRSPNTPSHILLMGDRGRSQSARSWTPLRSVLGAHA